jgi:hypothetical protein
MPLEEAKAFLLGLTPRTDEESTYWEQVLLGPIQAKGVDVQGRISVLVEETEKYRKTFFNGAQAKEIYRNCGLLPPETRPYNPSEIDKAFEVRSASARRDGGDPPDYHSVERRHR